MTKKKFKPLMTDEERLIRSQESRILLTEARAETERVKSKQAQVEYDKACDQLIYIESAKAEFDKVMEPLVSMLKILPQNICMKLQLKPMEHQAVIDEVNKIFDELSRIEFKFDTAKEVDERLKAESDRLHGKYEKKGKSVTRNRI